MKAATIYDVARAAGVSHQTVSRYLRGFAGIRPQTRDRVEAALTELEYRPNATARMLRSGHIDRIGVLVHAIEQAGPSRTLSGAAERAGARGFVLDVVSMNGDDPRSIETALRLMSDRQIAGLIATAQTDSVVDAMRTWHPDIPFVADVEIRPGGAAGGHDEEAIGALAANHLLAIGHRDLAYVAGPETWGISARRRKGFVNAVRASGGRVVAEGVGDWTAASGSAAAASIRRHRTVTAIACGNDSMALGVLANLLESGVQVPDDVSVMGTDDTEDAAFFHPALSTVAIDFVNGGGRLVDEVLLQAGVLSPSEIIEPRPPAIITRASTAGPRR